MDKIFIALAHEKGHAYIIGSFLTLQEADDAMLDEEIKRGTGVVIGSVVESHVGVSKNDPYDEMRPACMTLHRPSDMSPPQY